MNLKEIKELLKKNNSENNSSANVIFQHWNIPEGSSCSLRFLPWPDPITKGFWSEQFNIPMVFTDPEDDSKTYKYFAPSLTTYQKVKNSECPLASVVTEVYNEAKIAKKQNDEAEEKRLSTIASSHWLKPSFLLQGFVAKSSLNEENTPENPIRVFRLNRDLFNLLRAPMENDDEPLDVLPTGEFTLDDVRVLFGDGTQELSEDFLNRFDGYNFLIKKQKGARFPDYSTSSLSRTKSQLTEDQLQAINQYGFHDLRKFLPEQPSSEQYEVLADMLRTSIARAKGESEGYWNKEWEEYGIVPVKYDNNNLHDSDDGSKTKSVSSTIKQALVKSSDKNSTSNLLKKINSRNKEEVNEDGEVTVTKVAKPSPTQEEDKTTSVMNRIRSRIAEAKKE